MVSVKGQVVLPADARVALGMTPGKAVTVIPDLVRKQVVIMPLGQENPVDRGYGLLSGKVQSLTRQLMKEKIREADCARGGLYLPRARGTKKYLARYDSRRGGQLCGRGQGRVV